MNWKKLAFNVAFYLSGTVGIPLAVAGFDWEAANAIIEYGTIEFAIFIMVCWLWCDYSNRIADELFGK